MFSILFAASVILPSVLGNCCFPQKMSVITYTSGNPQAISQLVDFSQNKMIARPMNDKRIQFELYELGATSSKIYTKYLDGSCTFKFGLPYVQCITDAAKTLGTGYLGGMNGVEVENWGVTVNGVTRVLTTSKDDCIPITAITISNKMTTTQFFVNVTSSVTDVSDLDQDVSTCVQLVDVVG